MALTMEGGHEEDLVRVWQFKETGVIMGCAERKFLWLCDKSFLRAVQLLQWDSLQMGKKESRKSVTISLNKSLTRVNLYLLCSVFFTTCSNCQWFLRHKTTVLLRQNEDAAWSIIGDVFSEIDVAKLPPDYLRHRVNVFSSTQSCPTCVPPPPVDGKG